MALTELLDRVRAAFTRRAERVADDYSGCLYAAARGEKLPKDGDLVEIIRQAGRTFDEFSAEAQALAAAIEAETIGAGLPGAQKAAAESRRAAAAEEADYEAAKKALDEKHQADSATLHRAATLAEAEVKRAEAAQKAVADASPAELSEIVRETGWHRTAVSRTRSEYERIIGENEALIAQSRAQLANVPEWSEKQAEREDRAATIARREREIGRQRQTLEVVTAIEADLNAFRDRVKALRHDRVRSPIEWDQVLTDLRTDFAGLVERMENARIRPVEVGA